jgi:hypothetical protein
VTAEQNKGTPAYTPTPWLISRRSSTAIETGQGMLIASTGGYSDTGRDSEDIHDEQTANAALIVRAVNSHAELLEALETLVRFYRENDAAQVIPEWEKARAAIAKARCS